MRGCQTTARIRMIEATDIRATLNREGGLHAASTMHRRDRRHSKTHPSANTTAARAVSHVRCWAKNAVPANVTPAAARLIGNTQHAAHATTADTDVPMAAQLQPSKLAGRFSWLVAGSFKGVVMTLLLFRT